MNMKEFRAPTPTTCLPSFFICPFLRMIRALNIISPEVYIFGCSLSYRHDTLPKLMSDKNLMKARFVGFIGQLELISYKTWNDTYNNLH